VAIGIELEPVERLVIQILDVDEFLLDSLGDGGMRRVNERPDCV